MLRAVLSILAGLAIAFVGVVATDTVFHAVVATGSPRAGNNSEAMRDFVAAQPGAWLAAVVAGWSIAVLLGSALASRLAQRGAWPGLVVTGMFLLATVANFLMVTHPMAMMVGGLVAVAASGWFGARHFGRAAAGVPT